MVREEFVDVGTIRVLGWVCDVERRSVPGKADGCWCRQTHRFAAQDMARASRMSVVHPSIKYLTMVTALGSTMIRSVSRSNSPPSSQPPVPSHQHTWPAQKNTTSQCCRVEQTLSVGMYPIDTWLCQCAAVPCFFLRRHQCVWRALKRGSRERWRHQKGLIAATCHTALPTRTQAEPLISGRDGMAGKQAYAR